MVGAELLRGRRAFLFIPEDRIGLAFLMLVGSLFLLEMALDASLSDSTLPDFARFEAFFPYLFWWDSLDRVDWIDALAILRLPLSSAGFDVFFPLTVLGDRSDLVTQPRSSKVKAFFLELSLGDSFGRVDVSLDSFVVVRRSFCSAVSNAFFVVDVLPGEAVWLILERPFDSESLDFFGSFDGLDRLEGLPTSLLPFDLVVFDSLVCAFRLVVDMQDLL